MDQEDMLRDCVAIADRVMGSARLVRQFAGEGSLPELEGALHDVQRYAREIQRRLQAQAAGQER